MHLRKGWFERQMRKAEQDVKNEKQVKAYARRMGVRLILECASCVDGIYEFVKTKRTPDGYKQIYKCESCGCVREDLYIKPNYNGE